MVPREHLVGFLGFQKAVAGTLAEDPLSGRVMEDLEELVGEGGGFVEAEAGFRGGWVGVRIIPDLLEEPINDDEVKAGTFSRGALPATARSGPIPGFWTSAAAPACPPSSWRSSPGGEIVALDRDPAALEVLRRRLGEKGLGDRITPCPASLETIPFPDGSFDLLWCEGALHALGFRESLRRWRRLLAPGGYLVAHDEANDVEVKAGAAEEEGYTLRAASVVPEEVWWRAYCAPAEAELARRDRAAGNPKGSGGPGADPGRTGGHGRRPGSRCP